MKELLPFGIELEVGDRFRQSWRGVINPMSFVVLNIDREQNSIRVMCISHDGIEHEEEWDDLNRTESAFDIGEYKIINEL